MRFLSHVPTSSGAETTSCVIGARSYHTKRPGPCFDRLLPSNTDVKERVGLNSNPFKYPVFECETWSPFVKIAFDIYVLKRICGSKKLRNEKHRSELLSQRKSNNVKSMMNWQCRKREGYENCVHVLSQILC